VPFGHNRTSVDATLIGNLGLGGPGFTVGGGRTDDVTGFADLIPQASQRWNSGVHNWMTYITGDIPVGLYSPTSLANLGAGHGAIDAGGGYTYFNEKTGHEFSAVLGFTYNFMNTDTHYENGVDMHLDWGASQFLTKQVQVGAVGYICNQLSCDSGSGDRVGCFESRVFGIGPQIGYIIPMDDMRGYLNLKAYGEFDSAHRPEGFNVCGSRSRFRRLVRLPRRPAGRSRNRRSISAAQLVIRAGGASSGNTALALIPRAGIGYR
jgi:hypothetical protein